MNQEEHIEQSRVMLWAAYESINTPELQLLYAIPNGGHRHIATAKKLKAEGVKPGVPDLCLPVPRGGYFGLYMEMKKEKRKGSYPTISKEQKKWLKELQEQNYAVWVAYGSDEGIATITDYINGKFNKILKT